MKIRKNLEGVFLAAVVLTTVTTYATAGAPGHRPTSNTVTTVAAAEELPVQTIVVVGKRLTAAEKAALN